MLFVSLCTKKMRQNVLKRNDSIPDFGHTHEMSQIGFQVQIASQNIQKILVMGQLTGSKERERIQTHLGLIQVMSRHTHTHTREKKSRQRQEKM